MRVIGTAGHVDHGKSTLVHALTGIHPDRLKEEREREMTIDLGFAWLTLNDEPVGVVDVPGHRDFIENMLAGIGGIDAALFVVAADEGVMPQTREHLAILDLLQINNGVVALTKSDLVDDEWIELIKIDLASLLGDTVLSAAAIIPVSARTGAGLDDLRWALSKCLASHPPKPDLSRPRLPVDRVFTMSGFGTVVTGTLLDGSLNVGDEIIIMPSNKTARVRGLQTHKSKLDRAVPGSRVAINLSGVDVSDIERGEVICYPNTLRPTELIDVQFRHLKDSDSPLKHNAEVKFFVGASETLATVRVLSGDSLAQGETVFLQIALAHPVVASKGDHFILRRPSPGSTLGGGVIVDPNPSKRHKRNNPETLDRLATLLRGTPEEILLQAIDTLSPCLLADAIKKSNLDSGAAAQAAGSLTASGGIIYLDKALVISRSMINRLSNEMIDLLETYHQINPLKTGLPREELKSKLKLQPKTFNAIVAWWVAGNQIVESGSVVRRPNHEVKLTPQQQANVETLLSLFRRDPYNSPSFKDSAALVSDDVLAVLVDRGDIVQVSSEVLFLRETYDKMLNALRDHLKANKTITVAQFRDMFNSSRKYALSFLEHLDSIGVTVRQGDERKLK
ncbi:MAG: selenocysteine-specific translation elongation factor [Chloroflexota bacterium]